LARLLRPERDFSRVLKHVVFFHGLNGSCDTTFLSSGVPPEIWPFWLNDVGDEVAVWRVDYGASGTRWQSGALLGWREPHPAKVFGMPRPTNVRRPV
jgi:hypothetical protein